MAGYLSGRTSLTTVQTADIADNAVINSKMADDSVGIADLSATGTASSSTFLRGDNAWASPGGSNVKEMLVMVCDGRARTVGSGTYTPQDVTAAQDTTTSYVDISGSTIAYTPPSGTTSVLYKFVFGMGYADSQAIVHMKFFIDSDEVTDGRRNYGAATQIGTNYNYEWLIRIGDGTDTASGRVPSWSSSKTLKMQARSYGTPQDAKMHGTTYWDGGGGSHVLVPTLTITALG